MSEQETDGKVIEWRAIANIYDALTNAHKRFNGGSLTIALHNYLEDEALVSDLDVAINGHSTHIINDSTDRSRHLRVNVGDDRITSSSDINNKVTIRLPKEAVKMLNDKFHEYGLSIPMIDVGVNGHANGQAQGADKYRSKQRFPEQIDTRTSNSQAR